MLLAALPVRRAAFRQLLSGQAVSFDDIAAAAGLSPEATRQAAQEVATVGMAELDERAVVGMDGLTTRTTKHSINLDGVKLWTWCAYDIVGISAALGTDARGSTRCGSCGRRIEVVVRRGKPDDGTVVGWLPNEACANVMAEFCPSALFFCSTEHLDDWLSISDKRGGEAMNLPALAERGRVEWSQLVSE